jgi:long-chain acyl-CoA synthetase
MHRDTLLGVFEDLARSHEEFLLYDDRLRVHRYTYSELGDAARQFAVRLQDSGIQKGDRVLLWGENRPEWLAALWGCLLSGAVVVPVDYRASADLVLTIQLVAHGKLLLKGDEVRGDIDTVPQWGLSSIEWRVPERPPNRVHVTRDDVAEVLFTSGATADPKGVIIQHKNILANIVPVEREVQKYKKYARPFHPIRFLNLLPLSHMFGQAMATFIPPMIDGVVVFMAGFNPHDIVRQVKTRRISVIVCVPKILEVLREYVLSAVPEAANPPAPGIHWTRRWWQYRRVHRLFGYKFWSFIVGAAPLDPELEEFWSRMGFVVIQGYGLTETAPIVTLNHPFHTRKGSVGKPIAGVEVKLSDDGEILVRGDNVSSGYLNADVETSRSFENGWFRTGDIGSLDEAGRLSIRGRKKEMIVTADGMNIFPEDVERVLNGVKGVRESAVVGVGPAAGERVHAVLVLENGANPDEIVRAANQQLEDHQAIRGVAVWPGEELPRTEGTGKIKRRELQRWVTSGGAGAPATRTQESELEEIVARYAPNRAIAPDTTLAELGLGSLDRIEMLVALERRFGVTLDEIDYAAASTVSDLKALLTAPALPASAERTQEPIDFPAWNRSSLARFIRRTSLPSWMLPLARIFVHVRSEGLEHLRDLQPPVIFAPTHQSHLDIPSLMIALPAKWRYRIAPAMSKEFFKAHFYPRQYTKREWFTNSLNYYLAALLFNAFPIPQREAGARQTMRYAGELVSEGCCIVIFPEGRITDNGDIAPFQSGVGMLASRLNVPVVPVRLEGLNQVLHRTWKFPRPGRVRVKFGPALHLRGDDYAALARQVEAVMRSL